MWYRQCKAPITLAYSIGLLTQLTPKQSGWGVWLGTLKMRDINLRDMKMRHHVAGMEIARHENARSAIVWNTECCICLSIAELLKVFTRLCDDVWRWRIQICTRSLGHLQRATADSETKIARLNRGMSIRRCKKRMHQPGEWCARARYDSGAYTRVQFLDVF